MCSAGFPKTVVPQVTIEDTQKKTVTGGKWFSAVPLFCIAASPR